MDGIFINLTPNDIILQDALGNDFTVKGNPDLITPTGNEIKHDKHLKAAYLTEKEANIAVYANMIQEHIKYPFTQSQIDKINRISKGRTRLLILDKKDVEYWSIGRFQCPFRNYRLFTWNNKKLVEYPIPKTYLDYVSDTVESAVNATRKFYNRTSENLSNST